MILQEDIEKRLLQSDAKSVAKNLRALADDIEECERNMQERGATGVSAKSVVEDYKVGFRVAGTVR